MASDLGLHCLQRSVPILRVITVIFFIKCQSFSKFLQKKKKKKIGLGISFKSFILRIFKGQKTKKEEEEEKD